MSLVADKKKKKYCKINTFIAQLYLESEIILSPIMIDLF